MNPLDLDTTSIWYGMLRLNEKLAHLDIYTLYDVHDLVDMYRNRIYQLTATT